ncbi:hypothetical protein BDW42DRAFT_63890 [Aspergillus taichungensis]|uniref:Uncharacterized protein n=1 Tax=Aspergillus taichungensis TaxID=482145 RepID=A0A2J5I144_9EURO|nr:hypothetical protein BDW42DRAFT_63890 [Aspergillus taichungensis]
MEDGAQNDHFPSQPSQVSRLSGSLSSPLLSSYSLALSLASLFYLSLAPFFLFSFLSFLFTSHSNLPPALSTSLSFLLLPSHSRCQLHSFSCSPCCPFFLSIVNDTDLSIGSLPSQFHPRTHVTITTQPAFQSNCPWAHSLVLC